MTEIYQNFSENNCKRKSDPIDNISNYQKKKKPKMMLYLKSLPIKMNVQTKKIYQAILTIKKDTCRSSHMRQCRVSENSPEEKAHHNEYKKEL